MKKCPKCQSLNVKCPECNTKYKHGTQCYYTKCAIDDQIPLDCTGCQLTVCNDLTGVLDFDMSLILYKSS